MVYYGAYVVLLRSVVLGPWPNLFFRYWWHM